MSKTDSNVSEVQSKIAEYVHSPRHHPLFLQGDSADLLQQFPDASIDFCMTSPPYWMQRQYQGGGIGTESDYKGYINQLLAIFRQVHRVLKPTGSLWLNLGDVYHNKGLLGLPWRIALALIDQQGWVLRNDIVWNKIKGPDQSPDKLRNVHEFIFHFVKQPRGFYYDIDSIRAKPRVAKVRGGQIVSATGVTGIRYRRQIELSTALNDVEKARALSALQAEIEKVAKGEISDFRMVIRNQQRTTHSNAIKVSGRAKELQQHGFYFLRYHPQGSKPSDVWEIIPEDTTHRSKAHYAAYPEDLCKIPLLATCPPHGIALDPFCGTGTTNLVAMQLFRKSIGIDISPEYIALAEQRCKCLL